MDDFEMKFGSYEEQKDDPSSVYQYYKKAVYYRNLYPEMETIFLCTNVEYSFISSTVVKDILRHGGDISHLVPQAAINIIEKILGGREDGSRPSGGN